MTRVCIESRHNYAPNTHLALLVRLTDAVGLRVTLDGRCDTKRERHRLSLYRDRQLKQLVATFHGPSGSGNWASPPDIPSNAVVLVFETDSSQGEWGFRLFLEAVDANGQAMAVPSVTFESVPAYTQGLRGKQDVTLLSECGRGGGGGGGGGGDLSTHLVFDTKACSPATATAHRAGGGAASSHAGRLKLITQRGKHVYVAGCRCSSLQLLHVC